MTSSICCVLGPGVACDPPTVPARYGPLFQALKGKDWNLADGAVSTNPPGKAGHLVAANAFYVPGLDAPYLYPILCGQWGCSLALTAGALPEGWSHATGEILHPGLNATWSPLGTQPLSEGNTVTVGGCGVGRKCLAGMDAEMSRGGVGRKCLAGYHLKCGAICLCVTWGSFR